MTTLRAYKVIVAAVLSLVAVPSSAGGRHIRAGAEWGVVHNVMSFQKSTFITSDRYLVESSDVVYDGHVNGMVTCFVGYDFLKRWNVALTSGCIGTRKGERLVPAGVKLTAYLSDEPGLGGGMVFAGFGSGFRKGAEMSWLGRAGYGYRIPLAGSFAVDVNASALFSVTHPDVYDKYSHKMVEKKDLGSSKSYNVGILLTLAVVF